MSAFQFNVTAALVGGAGGTSPAYESIATHTLEGVQSAQVTLDFPHQDAFGWAGDGNQELIQRPRAELQLSYLFASGVNERNIGFIATPSGTSSAFSSLNDERNYYLIANQAGQDAVAYNGTNSYVIAFGNGLMTRYALSAQVGQPTTVNLTIQGLNALIQPSGVNQPLPAIQKQSGTALTGLYTLPQPGLTVSDYFEAAPRNMLLTFDTGCAMGALLSGQNSCPIESFSFSVDMPRAEVKDLGWAYPNTRAVQWPVTIGIHADATLTQFQADQLNRYGCPDSGYSFGVGFKSSCTNTGDLSFLFRGAKLESESIAVSVGGGPAKASFNWSLKIYDLNRTNPGFFITTAGTPYSSIIFPQVGYVSGSFPLTFNLSTPCFLSVYSGPGILSGNSVFVTDQAATVVVRAAATDGTDTQDLTVTVG